jgi:hypothetical protein
MTIKSKPNGQPVCAICGKALELPESIKKGIGPECEARYGSNLEEAVALAKQLKENHIIPEEKGDEYVQANFISKDAAIKAAVKAGIPASRFWKACGGNRGARPALNADLTSALYKGRWYLPKEAVNQANLDLLLNMERKNAKAEKPVKEPKPAKEVKKPEAKKPEAKKPVKVNSTTQKAREEKAQEAGGTVIIGGEPVTIKRSPIQSALEKAKQKAKEKANQG